MLVVFFLVLVSFVVLVLLLGMLVCRVRLVLVVVLLNECLCCLVEVLLGCEWLL